MENNKLQELKDKRVKLKEEIRLQDFRKRIASQLAHIESLGESYTLHYKFEHLNWIESNLKIRRRDEYMGIHGDFQIDVDDSQALDNVTVKEEELNSDKFKKLLTTLIPESSSLIVCYQVGDPEIETSSTAFLANPEVFLSQPEAWILATDKSWIIESLWLQGAIRFIQLEKSVPTLIAKIITE